MVKSGEINQVIFGEISQIKKTGAPQNMFRIWVFQRGGVRFRIFLDFSCPGRCRLSEVISRSDFPTANDEIGAGSITLWPDDGWSSDRIRWSWLGPGGKKEPGGNVM